ncbi:MAG TPA: Wzz/FepE/Etk N-terminal domain-containing protein [Anaerolineae bacterium]|nr:Wzz/FepE/Etk N-terminal domain-containing protein [Anaerolineae bacterium]
MTNQESNQQQYPQNYPPYEDEINLIDYLLVLWKWKWLIIAGTLVFAVIAAVISLRMPEIYEISTVIKPGIAGVKDDGSFIYIDSVDNISGKINEGIYDRNIQKALHLNQLKAGINFKFTIAKETNMIKITSQWEEESRDLGIKATGQLLRFLVDDYERIVKSRKAVFDGQIFSKQNNIKKFEAQRELFGKSLKDIKRGTDGLKKEADNLKNNTEDLIKQRDLLLKESNAGAEIPLLLYSTTIQQNISYLNQINNQIYDFKEKEKEALQEIGEAERGIDTAKTEIDELEVNKEMIANIKVIQEPEVSLHPVKSKKKQIVLLATVVALFMAVFLAFFIEYIKNATRSTK